MIVNRFLTRKGWRVVAHSMLAACGVAFLYIVSRGAIGSSYRGYQLNPWLLGIEVALSLWAVVLGSILARSELMDRD